MWPAPAATTAAAGSTGAALDLERVALGVENILVKRNDTGVGETEVQILQNLSEEEAA